MSLLLKISRNFLFFLCFMSCYQSLWAEEKIVVESNPIKSKAIEFPSIEDKGGDFTLFSDKGAVSLSDFKGKVVAFYFGYTQCPDICPTNLSILSQALHKLSKQEMQLLQPLFISMDPGRDSPSRLTEYVNFFHPKFIGLSAAPDDLEPVVQQYGAFYEKVKYSNSAMLYGIDHTSEIYIIDKQGQLFKILPHASPVDIVVQVLREVIKQ